MHASPSAIEVLETRIAPATVFAIDNGNKLYSFDSATPNQTSDLGTITGIAAGQLFKAIDFRPATGELYGVAVSGANAPFTAQLFTINTLTRVATAVGAAFSTTLASDDGLGMDFNPVVDRIRLVTSAKENLRIDPNSGLQATGSPDTAITGTGSVAGLAYTNSYPEALTTTLFGIDFTNDDFVRIGGFNGTPSPDGGVGTKIADVTDGIASLGTTAIDRTGFDILTTVDGNVGFYTFQRQVVFKQFLARINLTTGVVAGLAFIGDGNLPIFDIAVQPLPTLTVPLGKTFTYTDTEGDLITVKTTAGNFDTAGLTVLKTLASEDNTRHEILKLGLSGDTGFEGATISFTAKKTATGGDGRVNLRHFVSTGVNLGGLTVAGNLQEIDAGTNSATIPAIKSLSVLSFGIANAPGQPAPISEIAGSVGVFKVKGDLTNAQVNIGGKLTTATIGGSLIGGDAFASGQFSTGTLGTFTLSGSIVGGSGVGSGALLGSGPSIVKIKGSIQGGTGESSGRVQLGDATSLGIGGSVVGGDGVSSGKLTFGAAKVVTIGGSVVGSGQGGGIATEGAVGTITINGSLIARTASAGGSGAIIGNVIKTLTIKGSVIGEDGAVATIGFTGSGNTTSQAATIAIGTLNIGGSVSHANLLAGGSSASFMTNPNASFGKITIGGDLSASSIVAGYKPGPQGFFGIGDTLAGNDNAFPLIFSDIASIVVKGTVNGTAGDGDHFGIIADHVASITIFGRKIPTGTALVPLQVDQVLGNFGDFRLRELA